MKELKDKGYFIMADGTKSSDYEDAGKKKKAKSETKPGKKRVSAVSVGKTAKTAKPAKANKKEETKVAKSSKKSDDDLDIESEVEKSESPLEASD